MTSNRKRHKSRYAFALRVAIRFQRWVDTSIGPGAKIHPLVRAAYYKGVQSGLDAAYLSELEHARRIAYNESKDDLEDASMIRMVMSRAIAACRRDLATGSELNDWNGAEERLERLQYELSYYIRLGVSPESAPPLGSRKARDQQIMGDVIEEDERPKPTTEPDPEPDTDDDWS
jgi:hypothetical protein